MELQAAASVRNAVATMIGHRNTLTICAHSILGRLKVLARAIGDALR